METVTSADGITIAYERTGSGPPLVLVHGTALDHKFWDLSDLRSALAEQNTVYAIDEGADPPTNIRGEWVCARACANGSRCLQRVTTPGTACVIHDDASAIIPPGGNQHTE